MAHQKVLTSLFLAAVTLAGFASGRQVAIPETRLRIIYKETGQPVEWVMIDETCLRTNLTSAERKELFERKKAAYEKRVGEGHQFPYEDFSDWRGEQFKTERSCGWRDFLHAEDGWITIPGVSDVRMDQYEIEITPAACNNAFYDAKGHLIPSLTDKSFPKFARMPEKERVLYAFLAPQCGLPPGTQQPSYEEGRYFLDAYEILLKKWPDLSWATDCYGVAKENPPYYKRYYWGTIHDHLVRMSGYLDWEPGYDKKYFPTEAQRSDLMERIRQVFCNDIRAKLKLWGDTTVPQSIADLDAYRRFVHCDIVGVQAPLSLPSPTAPSSPPPAQEK